MKKFSAFSIISLILLSSCSTFKSSERYPASIKNTAFVNLFQEIENSVSEGVSSHLECSQRLTQHYEDLYNITSKEVALNNFSDDQLNSLVSSSFSLRLEIKEQMKALKVSDINSKKCLTSIKNVTRALRYLEDYLIEVSYARSKKLGDTEYVTLAGEGSHFLTNPNYKFQGPDDLVSGDVILSRGNAYSSAAIARIGDDDSQFSHLTLVYKDDKEDLYTSEAHIEIGNVVAPFNVHIDEKNARTVVFRHHDKSLAHEAGKYMYNFINDYKAKKKKNIPYDFAMVYQNDDKIFCSEVIYHGYWNAGLKSSGIGFDVPEYKTTFSKGLIPFLNSIGVMVNKSNINTFETFGPGEIQFDSRFDIIAEWRNPTKLKDTRFKDAILSKIFEWMSRDGYEFKPKMITGVGNSFAWLMRKTGWTRSVVKALSGVDLEEKFPLNMTVKQMNVFVVLDAVGESLYKKLEEAELKNNSPLSFKELYEILENYRNSDLEVYNTYKKQRRENLRNSSGARDSHRARHKLVKPDFHLLFSK